MLETQQTRVASDVGVAADSVVYSYKHASHGFASNPVSAAGAAPATARSRGGGGAQPHRAPAHHRLATFLGMRAAGSLWPANGGQAKAGEGMVIGIVDTGIWPEHPSFSATGFSSARPAGWSGKCDTTSEFKCNNKIIGARAFYKAFKKANGMPDLTSDWLSPRDSAGHGSWCASAAAGNKDIPMEGGKASGMAPAARVAMYKVFWVSKGQMFGEGADIVAAVNQAVADGVDVISLSLGGMDPADTYFSHMPYLAANLAGVFVTYAAGNSGSPGSGGSNDYRSLDNFSPFYLTVGASSIARGGVTLKATAAAATALGNSSTATPAATPVPWIADFSSTGPVQDPSTDATSALPTNSILKPDIIGPGVSLYAAWPGTSVATRGRMRSCQGRRWRRLTWRALLLSSCRSTPRGAPRRSCPPL
ncbi:hypothetical protein CLOP_g9906 [Closterium sp. NIES-67]|nr:hypothetical protein CLOP_g9906 [Closterium sp. NIES-67]